MDMINEFARLLFQFFAAVLPGIRHEMQHIHPGRSVESRCRWKISATVKRASIGRQEYIQWPASASADRLNGVHINLIEVRPFFAVDFDIDKMIVHICSHPSFSKLSLSIT